MALGSHMVQFQVTNSLGDTVSETFPVEVISSGIYNAALELTDYLVYLPKDAQFYPAQYLKSFTWLGEQDSLAGFPRTTPCGRGARCRPDTPGSTPWNIG